MLDDRFYFEIEGGDGKVFIAVLNDRGDEYAVAWVNSAHTELANVEFYRRVTVEDIVASGEWVIVEEVDKQW